ncbi:hypothetical protein QQM39_10895 [Streptomyces sp. DT2A-34]|uniref:hypothetical protein n=1 Tax=Streptomyces sp. DT2A-34 TaxID=3051182 RepID=UPI00265BDA49|nr:hypothetical protein [Streptomyces sp. DT2A-34]MDO0911340.1 hypothetical protein [Streptomyces sp. DT2A-34]
MDFIWFVLAALAGALLVVYFLISNFRDHVGTRQLHLQRQDNVMTAFDGRDEVRVRWSGTGMTIEQIVWYGRQYGYDLYCLSGTGSAARKLVMRRLPYGPPPHPMPGYGQPHAAELAAIAKDVRRTVNPEAIVALAGMLVVMAGVCGFAARDRYQAGDSFFVPLAIAVVLVLLALGVAIGGRVALLRRRRRFVQHKSSGYVAPPGRSGGAQ